MEYLIYFDKGQTVIWCRTGKEYRISFDSKTDALDFLKSLVEQ